MKIKPSELFRLARRALFIVPAYILLVLFCAVYALGWGWNEAVSLWEEML